MMKCRRIISLFTIAVLVLSLFGINVLAVSPRVTAVNSSYSGGTTTVSGSATCSKVLIVILDGSSNQIALDNATVTSGSFTKAVSTGTLTSGATYSVKVCNLDGDTDYTSTTFVVPSSGGTTPTAAPTTAATPVSTPTAMTSPTPLPTPPAEPTAVTVKESTITSAILNATTGEAVAQIAEKQIADTVAKAIEEAKSQEGTANTVVEIKVEAVESAKEVTLELTKSAVETIANSTVDVLSINAGVSTLNLDQKTLDTIKSAAASLDTNAKVSVSVAKVDTSVSLAKYPEPAKKAFEERIGDRPVYDFNISVGDTKVSSFNGGTVNISVPYTPRSGEDTSSIIIFYIDDKGNLKSVPSSKFDPVTKTISFGVRHFSQYAVAYNKVAFKDVAANAWYNKAVSYIAARTIINGLGNGMYEPEKNVTRADFLIMVMKAYGIDPAANTQNNFADAGNKYYTPYLATARHLGLVSGTGTNRFLPESRISRQDMCVILYRALDNLGSLPTGTKGGALESFNDAASINSYAKTAMELFVKAGTISGYGNNLDPKTNSTRSQAAQVLYNLLVK